MADLDKVNARFSAGVGKSYAASDIRRCWVSRGLWVTAHGSPQGCKIMTQDKCAHE